MKEVNMERRLMIFVTGIIVLIFLAEVFAPEILKGDTFIDQELKLTDRQVFDEVLSGRFPISREHSQQLINFLNDNPDKKKQFLFTRGINYEEKELEGVTKILDYEYNQKYAERENIRLRLVSGKEVDLTIRPSGTEQKIKTLAIDIKMREGRFKESIFKVQLLNFYGERDINKPIENDNSITIKDSSIIIDGNFNLVQDQDIYKIVGQIKKSDYGKFSLSRGSEFIKTRFTKATEDDYLTEVFAYRDLFGPIEVISAEELRPKNGDYLMIKNNGKIERKGEKIQMILNPLRPLFDENYPESSELFNSPLPKLTYINTPSGLLISQTPQESQTPKPYLSYSNENNRLSSSRNPFTRSLAYLPSLGLQQGNNQFTSQPTSSTLCISENCRVKTYNTDNLPNRLDHLRNQLLGERMV